MIDKWQFYSQTGVDGPEYGVRIGPGYVVVGFQKEDAQAIVAWQNASIQPEGDILERAKAQLAEGYTAINESVVRELITEVERLRSVLASCRAGKHERMRRHSEEIAVKDARIKELEVEAQGYHDKKEEALTLLSKQNRYIEGLEAAFLDNYLYIIEHRQCHYPGFGVTKEMREEAREALEQLRAGGKDDRN